MLLKFIAIIVVLGLLERSLCASICDNHMMNRLRHLDKGMREVASDFFDFFCPPLLFPFEPKFTLMWERFMESLLSNETTTIYFWGGFYGIWCRL